jgi:hypothetical protein
MSRATTIAFAQDIAVTTSNTAALTDYYDAQIIELGKLGMTTVFANQAATAGSKTYGAPANATALWAVFFDGVHIPLGGHRELEAIAADWRSQPSGFPTIATYEGEGDKVFSFFPTPASSELIGMVHSAIVVDTHSWLEGYLAFEALAREFSRETAQQDMNFSQAARFLANLFGKLVF